MSKCQRPKRAFFISTGGSIMKKQIIVKLCQRPKRAFFISTVEEILKIQCTKKCVNALNGLSSFLRYPLKPRINTGFPASFLQVFV